MKKIFVIASLLVCFTASAQRPNVTPQLFKYDYYKFLGYISLDSGLMLPVRNPNFIPLRAGMSVYNTTDSTQHIWSGYNWQPMATRNWITNIFNGTTPISGYNKLAWDSAFKNAVFDTTTRELTLTRAGDNSTETVLIPRGGSVNGITTLTPSRSGNIVTLSGDNGSVVQFGVRDVDSAAKVNVSDTGNMLLPYAYKDLTNTPFYDSTLTLRAGISLNNKYKIAAWGDSFTDYGASYWQDSLAYWQGMSIFNGGVAGEDAAAIRARMVDSVSMHTWPTIIWAGRNGFPDTAAVLSNIGIMVDSLRANRNERFLVISILNPIGAPIGTGDYNLIIYLNNRLKNLYPNNYVELRRFLVLKYNANDSTDVVDFTNDVIPSSLRIDGTHLNALGNYWVAVRFNQYISTLTGNPQQWFQNVVSGGFQAKGTFQRDNTAPGTEMFYDTITKRGYIDVYDATVPAYRGLDIRVSDLNIVTDNGTVGTDAVMTINNQLIVTKSINVTDTIKSNKIIATGLPEFTTGTRYYMLYDAPDNGQIKYKTEDSIKAYLGLNEFLVKSDTIGTGYTPNQRFYDSLENVQSRMQTKQQLISTGITNYFPKFTGSSTFDTSIIYTLGGRVGVGTTSIQSGFDIENSIDGLPASSGSAPRGGLRISNSHNIALDFGTYSTGQAWVQVSDAGNYASNFSLSLNPNGGNILIGTTSDNGTDKLQVNGNVNIGTNTLTAGDAALSGAINTGAPITTAAGVWKLGTFTATTAYSVTGFIIINIGGIDYAINAAPYIPTKPKP